MGEPQWVALYYCGGAPGVKENYEGACLVTPDGQLPTDPDEMAKIDAVYAAAGITMACLPDNSAEACAGHHSTPCKACTLGVNVADFSFCGFCESFCLHHIIFTRHFWGNLV